MRASNIQDDTEIIERLNNQGWDQAAIDCFVSRTMNLKEKEQADLFLQSQRVGSEVYTAMFLACQMNVKAKALLVIKQMGGEVDSFGMLQLHGPLLFDDAMSPDSEFLEAYADCVYDSYTTFFTSRALDDMLIHQFRYHIDRHNIWYIRKNYKKAGITDEEALCAYAKSHPVGYYMIAERGRLHNKYPGDATYQQFYGDGKQNRKKLTPNFHSEFILDKEGSFVSQWNILEKKNGFFISDPMYYKDKYSSKSSEQAYTWEEARLQVANTESFNYGRVNGRKHMNLDAVPVKDLDPPYRKLMISGYNETEKSLIDPTLSMYQKKMEKQDNWSR